MADDLEEGPDPNDVRRHAKRMFTEAQYRQKYCRLDFYRPNLKQLEFHSLRETECMLRAGNQLGKTHGAGAQMAMDILARYPDGPEFTYTGRRFLVPPAIERPFDFLAWAACDTSATTRAGAQTKLLGDLSQDGGLGTGLIPLDSIVGKPSMARGIADFCDSATVRRDNGGTAVVRFKTYEMGRKAFQGEPVDEIWIDEDPGGRTDDDIYGECLARLTTTSGKILVSMTPMLGLTPLRKRFKEGVPGTREVLMTILDCLKSKGGHIPDEELSAIVARTKANQLQTRLYGADMQGEGAVFSTPVEQIKHGLDPRDVPLHWRWLWALDFRHSGSATSGHPFAAALLCRDLDNDAIYVTDAFRMLGLAANHVARIRENPMKAAPVAWPHDGGRGDSIVSGETVAKIYKGLGLNMLPTHATFPEDRGGGFSFEGGITDMEERFAAKRLLIARHLTEAIDEYTGYHRKDGRVVKIDDDIMSAIRIGVMAIRHAKPMADFKPEFRRWPREPSAAGTDFDLFTGA